MTIEARIRGQIEARIRSGEWAPGTRIPFEHELVAEHGCARATVNKALSHLAREGLIERRRRAGSFVAQPRIRSAVVGVPDIGALIAARGETYRWELLTRAIDGGRLTLTGVHHAGATPFGWESRWLDLATVPEAAGIDFAAEAPGAWLLHSVPWTDARHRIC
ncbi:GntR family transcriptional regulator, partial [Sphingomonas sp. AOB5]|uniref:GntR family transcriptional regulator n=1 Tax=Sphingomonas sp. AOB5 TaxID=3034017 RepID=UPI0023F96A8D